MQIGLIRQAKILFLKEIRTEWRNRYAINGILIQLVSAVFIANLCFQGVRPAVWNALFWIIMLFTTVNAITRSFVQERPGRLLYLHTTVHPLAVLIGKMLLNAFISILINIVGFVVFAILLGIPEWDIIRYGTLVLLFAIGNGLLFTTLSAIASKTKSGGIIMPLLSFPLVIPMLLVGVSGGVQIVMGMTGNFFQNVSVLALIDVLIAVLGIVLFRFLWQD